LPALVAAIDVDVLNTPGSDKGELLNYFLGVPLIARAEAEELYLPRGVLDKVREEPPFERGRLLLLRLKARDQLPPVVAEVKPGRNEPCGCGSGKKFKKCCEQAA
jgi:hypothetical protein